MHYVWFNLPEWRKTFFAPDYGVRFKFYYPFFG